MLIHGRLILTKNGMMLDEVRSLLQKSLRRKDRSLITMATKELLGYGKDQLPWKSLMTFLFEDHCLSDEHVLERMYLLHQQKNKYKCVELLFKCYTCRLAACLPVVALETAYDPCLWETAPTLLDPNLVRLVAEKPGNLDFGLLLANLQTACLEDDEVKLLSCIKLATIAIDHETRSVTKKGEAYFITTIRAKQKPNVGLVVLSALYKVAKTVPLKQYIFNAFKLATLPEAPLRLILFSVYTQAVYKTGARQLSKDMRLGQIDWSSVPALDQMPEWAVDKHTFRGRYGKGTKHLVKVKPNNMSDAHYDLFHGERPKSDIRHFFEEGCHCEKEAVKENPFWEKTKAVYYSKPHKLQKTIRMTAVYYKDIVEKYPFLVHRSDIKQNIPSKVKRIVYTQPDIGEIVAQKRKSTSNQSEPSKKRLKLSQVKDEMCNVAKYSGNTTYVMDDDFKTTKINKSQLKNASKDKESQTGPTLCRSKKVSSEQKVDDRGHTLAIGSIEQAPIGPLLQLPTGCNKVYTRLDLQSNTVWKGPYPPGKLKTVLFFHKVMKDILGDLHTLPISLHHPYVHFSLLKAEGATVKTHTKDYYDAISKKRVEKGEFVSRESIGIVQLHNMTVPQINKVPMSVWAHFMYRYFLNVGDSGLYNAITDTKLSFFYGIDMEEQRANVAGNDVVNCLFSKLPKKAICDQILRSVRKKKEYLADLLDKFDYEKLSAMQVLNKELGFDLNVERFTERMKLFKTALGKL